MARASRGSRKTSGPTQPEIDVAQHVRQNYERRPYPPLGRSRRFRPVWCIAPIEWIDAMCPPAHSEPRRILIAGCGTGNEAFALRKRFPKAEIVAVDFSARTLTLARQTQAKLWSGREIKFRRADLTARDFRKAVHGQFDFITCHGVLSYIPEPGRALRNLADVLAPSGVLYLGVNGARHFSADWRPVLEGFGFDLNAFEDSRQLRDLLALCETLADYPANLQMAKQPSEYLAGDLFGAMIANHSLDRWVALAGRAGLHFYGSYAAHHILRRALNSGLYDRLASFSRPTAHAIAERIAPSGFHRLVFSSAPPVIVPWNDHARLLRCRMRLTKLYEIDSPGRRKPRGAAHLSLRSKPTNTRADLAVPAWIATLLRATNNGREVREILGDAARTVSPRSLRKYLCLLHLLGAINPSPPDSSQQ